MMIYQYSLYHHIMSHVTELDEYEHPRRKSSAVEGLIDILHMDEHGVGATGGSSGAVESHIHIDRGRDTDRDAHAPHKYTAMYMHTVTPPPPPPPVPHSTPASGYKRPLTIDELDVLGDEYIKKFDALREIQSYVDIVSSSDTLIKHPIKLGVSGDNKLYVCSQLPILQPLQRRLFGQSRTVLIEYLRSEMRAYRTYFNTLLYEMHVNLDNDNENRLGLLIARHKRHCTIWNTGLQILQKYTYSSDKDVVDCIGRLRRMLLHLSTKTYGTNIR